LIELLSNESEISIRNSEFGKHANLKYIENRFGFLVDLIRSNVKIISIVRQPHKRLESLYQSHYSNDFIEREELFTGNMSAEDFIETWCIRHAAQIPSTYSMCLGLDDQFAADYLINFENLENDLRVCMDHFDIEIEEVPTVHLSEKKLTNVIDEQACER
jgi:hypothetical protein